MKTSQRYIENLCKHIKNDYVQLQKLETAYKERYKECLIQLMKLHDLDGNVRIDKKLIHDDDDCWKETDYIGELDIDITNNKEHPYKIVFVSPANLSDKDKLYGNIKIFHAFYPVTPDFDNCIDYFEKYVLPYVEKLK